MKKNLAALLFIWSFIWPLQLSAASLRAPNEGQGGQASMEQAQLAPHEAEAGRAPKEQAAVTTSMTGWIGTYTSSNGLSTGSPGIYAFQWNAEKGSLSAIRPVGTTTNPSFLALHPSGRFLYAVNEDGSSSGTDHITAFAIGAGNEPLRAIGTVSSQGLAPCHLTIDATGKWLFVANYLSGTIAVYAIQPDGRLAQASQVIQHKAHSSGARRVLTHMKSCCRLTGDFSWRSIWVQTGFSCIGSTPRAAR